MKLFVQALVVDVVFLFGLLFFGYPAVLGLLFYTPIQLCQALPACFEWLEERVPGSDFWGQLSRAMCGSGLLFLVLGVGHLFTGDPDEMELWGILALVYLNLWLLRFYCAGMINGFCSLVCLILGKDALTRLSAFSALSTSAAGLYLYREIFQSSQLFEALALVGVQSDAMIQTLFLVVFFALNFGACLVCGGITNWLAMKWND